MGSFLYIIIIWVRNVVRKCKEITIPVNEDLTWYLEKAEEVVSLQYFLELMYGIKIDVQITEDIDGIIECLKHLEEVLKR